MNLYKIKQFLKSTLWLITDFKYFKRDLKGRFGVTNVKAFKFFCWHHGAYYFKGEFNGEKVFIKSDYKFGLLSNEINAYDYLKQFSKINQSMLVPLFYDDIKYSFVGYQFIEAVTLDKFISGTDFNQNDFNSVVDKLLNILDGLFLAEIVYRDFKMDNFFVMEDGSIVLIDFSFAISPRKKWRLKEIDRENRTNLKILGYMGAPSQKEKYIWDDAFGMAALLYDVSNRLNFEMGGKLLEINKRIGRLEYHLFPIIE